MPSEPDISAIRSRIERLTGETVERDLPSRQAAAVTQCLARDCDPRQVGNGRCDINCYNEDCKWDGNDCGGPALNLQGGEMPQARVLLNTGTGREACMLKRSDWEAPNPPLPTGIPTPLPAAWRFNYWEECNGVGRCVQGGDGRFSCQCPDNCGTPSVFQWGSGGTAPAGLNADNSIRKCMYCGAPVAP